jgi:hypothetical protein
MPPEVAGLPSLFVLFLVVLVIIVVLKIAVFAGLGFLLVFIVIIVFVGDEVEMHRMRLRNFQLRFALRATQDFAFFHLVFIDIDFGGTFRAADHDFILRGMDRAWPAAGDRHLAAYYIPRDMKSTPGQQKASQKGTRRRTSM